MGDHFNKFSPLISQEDVTDGTLQANTSNRDVISGSVLGDKRETQKESDTADSNPCISTDLQGNLVRGTEGFLETPMATGQAIDSVMLTANPPQQAFPSVGTEAACGSLSLLRTATLQQTNTSVGAETVANRYCGILNHSRTETVKQVAPVGAKCGTVKGNSGNRPEAARRCLTSMLVASRCCLLSPDVKPLLEAYPSDFQGNQKQCEQKCCKLNGV